MGRDLAELMEALPAGRRKRVEKLAAELRQQHTLAELRNAHAMTQDTLGKKLKIGQVGVSKLEKRGDVLLSTLDQYVAALGGKLRLIVEMDDRLYEISGFGKSEPSPPPAGKKPAAKKSVATKRAPRTAKSAKAATPGKRR